MPNRGLEENIFQSAIPKKQVNSPMPMNQNPVIRNAGMFLEPTQPNQLSLSPMSQPMPEPQDDDSGRFLASLIAQGAAGFGTGMMGGSAADIQRSAGTFQTMRDTQENQRRAKQLTDPNSEESKRKREVYKSLGFQVPNNLSATDLNDPTVLQTLKGNMEQSRLAAMPRGGGGVGGAGKPEKEIKSNQKSMAEYREHVSSLAEMGNVLNKIKLLNRTGIGTITPDFSVDTQAYATSLDRAAQPMIKTLAGPGTLQKEERDTYGKLVPTGNTRADLALRQANDIIVEGTDKALSKMNADLSTGDISKRDYDALINQYNEQLSKKGIGINQIINPSTGRLETRQKREVTLKDGKKVIVDQFGYTWE
jgi:hypothetical protein